MIDTNMFNCVEWYRAITLRERINLRSSLQTDGTTENDLQAAKHYAEKWYTQYPFMKDVFPHYLEANGISEAEFLHILTESDEHLKHHFPAQPPWLSQLNQAFSSFPYDTALPDFSLPPIPFDIEGDPTGAYPFIAAMSIIILPVIKQTSLQISDGLKKLGSQYAEPPFEVETLRTIFLKEAQNRLSWMMGRTLVLELNVARVRGLLTGNSSEERFRSYFSYLHQETVALQILKEYPVLARQAIDSLEVQKKFFLEFLEHLCNDWSTIKTVFCKGENPGNLVELMNVGDQHRGGKSVLIAKFSSGFQIVYKPKCLAIEAHFQEFLEWINSKHLCPTFKTLTIINRGTYGWVEFVPAEQCHSEEEVFRFYERQGAYLALLYVLHAPDFHQENVIASGEHPVLIDLETLFHPRATYTNLEKTDALVQYHLGNSVMSVGFLPGSNSKCSQAEWFDISGLGGGSEEQLTPVPVPVYDNVGRDDMRLNRKRIKFPGSQNQPVLHESKVNLNQYVEALVIGFTKMYHLLVKYRDELLSSEGILRRFEADEIRVILNSTNVYSRLLAESFHPDVLRNALDRERLLNALWGGNRSLPIDNGYRKRIVLAEQEQLSGGDIPLFTTRTDSRDLFWGDQEQECLINFFEEPGLVLVQKQLQLLNESDLERQIWFIRASLASRTPATIHRLSGTSLPHSDQLLMKQTNREQLLTEANAVAKRLRVLSLCSGDEATWIGLKPNADHTLNLSSTGTDLYSGLPGIILFLAYLGHVTQQNHYTELAQAGLKTLQRRLKQDGQQLSNIGAFTGWGGIIYTLSHLGVIWDRSDLLRQAEEHVLQIVLHLEKDETFDIISGAAGCIGGLLSLYHCSTSQQILEAAIKCGDHLLKHAQSMPVGIGWTTPFQSKPLAGFSHGASGIAWALLKLSELTGMVRFRNLALEAVRYERTLYSDEEGNWLDLRESVLEEARAEPYMVAWCHGAPGIGLARLQILPYIQDDVEILTEINIALQTTLDQGFGGNHSLCHGDLGNLELLLQAQTKLYDPLWSSHLERVVEFILNSIQTRGWLCGIPYGVETPGLMVGLAGIGYQLLRLAVPDQIPSLIAMENPYLAP